MCQPSTSSLDPEYFWNFITFSVESRLFRVPTYRFIQESNYFSATYDMSVLGPDCGLEHAHMHAVELDVALVDFQAFLKVLYPRERLSLEQISLTQEEWVSVLKLSSKWFFRELRERAMKKMDVPPVLQRISLAEECNIPLWLEGGYTELAMREETISLEDAGQIGLRNTIRLYEVRDRCYRGVLSLDGVVEAIHATFAHELGRMHEANNQHLSKQLAGLIKAPQDVEEEEYPLDKKALKQQSTAVKKRKKRSERESQSAAKGGQEGTGQEVAQHNPQSPVVGAQPLPQDSPGAAESI